MVRKEGNFPYNISDFEKKAEKYFPNENIVVGARCWWGNNSGVF